LSGIIITAKNQRGEKQAVDENHQAGLFQVFQLGMLDLAIDLGEGFFAAHRQNGVPKSHEEDDPGKVADPTSGQPAERFFVEMHHPQMQRIGGYLNGDPKDRDGAPDDQQHHHDGGDHHDLQRFLAGFVDALDVLPPEIQGD
jgi:hypothetical protein